MSGILSDITVVDMTEGVAGPYAAMVLADMGANVVKVERPEGDWSRTAGRAGIAGIGSTQFAALNRNKRNICLDVGTDGGRDVVERLIGRADVLVSNYRAGVMAKLGLDSARCQALNPRLVYCTVSGFGQEGPYAQYPASDTIMQAMTGVMSLTGEPDGAPLRVGFPLIDMAAANYAVQAMLLALYGRLAGRGGAVIDVSLMAAAQGLMASQMTDYLATGRLARAQGNKNSNLAPAGAYEVAGGRWITIAVLRNEHWVKLCAALGLEHLVEDERFRTNAERLKHRAALDELLVPMFKSETAEHLLQRLRAADILCGQINTLADVAADAALSDRLPIVDAKVAGVPRAMGVPIRYDGQYFGTRLPPAAKGQHTREILAELGYSDDNAARLVQARCAVVQS